MLHLCQINFVSFGIVVYSNLLQGLMKQEFFLSKLLFRFIFKIKKNTLKLFQFKGSPCATHQGCRAGEILFKLHKFKIFLLRAVVRHLKYEAPHPVLYVIFIVKLMKLILAKIPAPAKAPGPPPVTHNKLYSF